MMTAGAFEMTTATVAHAIIAVDTSPTTFVVIYVTVVRSVYACTCTWFPISVRHEIIDVASPQKGL